ncbi:hypothetical protein ElyMa_003023200 [Elysia marginata]|uniref:Uncharacterized protein n=1 Tax=Elysia marginata TaxID=1093978 RepID=A0AAV4II94_9GAST|nr:hypothetical protein ElyMa_003023200 [Elysia marginata]
MQSADNLLFSLQEIFQVVLYAESSQIYQDGMSDLNFKVTVKQGDQKQRSNESYVSICNVKVSCNQCVNVVQALQAQEMPALYSFVCALQKQTKNSHLAVQTTSGGANDEQKTTSILWLEEAEIDGSDSEVKVANKIVKPVKGKEDCGIVIQIRVRFNRQSRERCIAQ